MVNLYFGTLFVPFDIVHQQQSRLLSHFTSLSSSFLIFGISCKMGKRSLQQMQADNEVDNDDEYDNDYEDASQGEDDESEVSEVPETKRSTKSDADIPLFEKLKALQRQQEEDSFASVVSSNRRKKVSVRKHLSKDSEEERETRKTNKHGPAIMRSDRPVKR